MFGLSKHGPDGRYAIIFDVGSATVGVAITASDIVTKENPIVYTHREVAVLRSEVNEDSPTRYIEEAFMRALMVLEQEGIAAMRRYDKHATIDSIVVSVAAPWAYTITQQAEYIHEVPFTITETLIESLVATAEAESVKNAKTIDFLSERGLEVVTSKTLHMTANGYTVNDPIGLEASKLYISHSSGIVSSHLVETIITQLAEVYPDIVPEINTFMLAMYMIVRDQFPNIGEACMVDVTGEATEIGLIRNGELRKVTHTLVGHRTVVRALETKLKLPNAQAATLITDTQLPLNDKQRMVFDSICEEYIDELAIAFRSLGDTLSIPKSIYLHTDERTEPFFGSLIKRAAERATKGNHLVFPLTSNLLPGADVSDSALKLSSYLFHKSVLYKTTRELA
jgi:cell division ATPase FtsA